MRKIILSILGLLLIFGAFSVANYLASLKKAPMPVEQKNVASVFVQTVRNNPSPITISAHGSLVAKQKVEIFSEVQGIFLSSDGVFKPGSPYSKGQVLLRLDSDEFKANILAQKSNLYNQIINFLPDLRLDYPDEFSKWQEYAQRFDVTNPLQPFPSPTSEREKLFVSGKGIHTTFHTISNLEERLAKYVIKAPFSGVLTETLVNPGSLISPGQRIAQFIGTGAYEVEVNVSLTYMDLLKVGRSVTLHNTDRSKKWNGKVVRVNGKADPNSQTIKVYIEVAGADLKEGMYLEADLEAKQIENTFELDRQLLLEGNKVYVVNDTILGTAPVTPVFFKENTVIVQGLTDGTSILARPVPGAHPGLRVKVI